MVAKKEIVEFTPPRNDRGWSREIVTAQNAIVVPPTNSKYRKPAGVLFADGTCCHHSLTWRFSNPLTLPPKMPNQIEETILGRWLWGGVLFDHFGHFLIESLSRLWALESVKNINGIVFIPRRPKRDCNLHKFQSDVLRNFGRDLPVKVISNPTAFDELVIPGQGLGLSSSDASDHSISLGTPEMQSYMSREFSSEIEPNGGELLYVSRSQLGFPASGILGEDILEDLLSKEGYDIFHPQTVDVETQISKYKAARKIVLMDGSAAHLFAFIGRENQSTACIRRRTYWTDGLVQQISGFTGRKPFEINALEGEWFPRSGSVRKRISVGQLNFPELGDLLHRAGFVKDKHGWSRVGNTNAAELMQEHGLTDDFIYSPKDNQGAIIV